MHEERIDAGGIPARLYRPDGARGLLLLGHGGGRSKDAERFVGLAREHAVGTGLAVVCIDAVDHGERRPTGVVPGGLPAGWHSRVADRMVADWTATAAALADVGPAVAYVGFSMGAIFGFPTVAALTTITTAVFVVGGIPAGGGIDDPALGPKLLEIAARLGDRQVLLLNKTGDEVFPPVGVHELFAAIPGDGKRLMFWPGGHDDWPPELIRASVDFVRERTPT